MTYDAITIDTSIFDRSKCRLELGLLAKLTQFKGMPIRLVLSEIIIREVIAHLKKTTHDTTREVEKVLKNCSLDLVISDDQIDDVKKLLISTVDTKDQVKNRLEKFIAATGAEILLVEDHTSLKELIGKYFNSEPPFAKTGNKKNEFPDALALFSLEGWAAKNDMKILAVSTDGDWKRFAEQSKYIDLSDDLATALSSFQPDNDAVKFCETLNIILSEATDSPLAVAVFENVSEKISGLTTDAEAESQFGYEVQYVELSVLNVAFDSDTIINPVQAQEKNLVIQMDFEIVVTANSGISFSMRDPIDKDYLPMGSTTATVETEFEVECLIELEGDFSKNPNNLNVVRVEILSELESIDFGYVEPDWMHEPDDF